MDDPITEQEMLAHIDLMALAIERQDLESLQLYLDQSPLGKIDRQLSDNFLRYFLEISQVANSYDAANMVIMRWELDNGEFEEDRPTRTNIFTIPGIDPSTALFSARVDPKGCWIGHMMKLAMYPSGPLVERACTLLTDIYGEQPNEVYKKMLLFLEEIRNEDGETNDLMREYVLDLYRLVSEYADVPSYIRQGNYEVIPFHDELVDALIPPSETQAFEMPSDEKLVDMLIDKREDIPGLTMADQEQLEQGIIDKISTLDRGQKMEIMKLVVKSKEEYQMFSNPDVFRVLGPAHPMSGSELDTDLDHPCAKWGGCRMMTCIEFSNFDEDDEVYDEMIEETKNYAAIDWFTGACDFCNKRIRAKHQAVRMPMVGGGWKGCYCKWKDVRADVEGNNPEAKIILGMIDDFEKEFKAIGILDRQWKEEEPEPLPELSYDEFVAQGERFKQALRAGVPDELPPIVLPVDDDPSLAMTEMTLVRQQMGMT